MNWNYMCKREKALSHAMPRCMQCCAVAVYSCIHCAMPLCQAHTQPVTVYEHPITHSRKTVTYCNACLQEKPS